MIRCVEMICRNNDQEKVVPENEVIAAKEHPTN